MDAIGARHRDLAVRMLGRLGLEASLEASEANLERIYLAWSRHVPFDNLLRRVSLQESGGRNLPRLDPWIFIEWFLRCGAGGTCTSSSGALLEILRWIGYEVAPVTAVISREPAARPANHVAVGVRLGGGEKFLLDTMILCERPIPLHLDSWTSGSALHPVSVAVRDGTSTVSWVLPYARRQRSAWIRNLQATHAECDAIYQQTRMDGPFNEAVFARKNGVNEIVCVARDRLYRVDARGSVRSIELKDRTSTLIEEFGYDAALVESLPEDEPPRGGV